MTYYDIMSSGTLNPTHSLSPVRAVTFEGLDLLNSFQYAGISLEYLGQGRISRSRGQGMKRDVSNRRPAAADLKRL